MNRSAVMHRCLKVKKLVSRILLAASGSGDKGTIAAMARVAKFFHIPAIALLWERQDGLNNLLNCLPKGVCARLELPAGKSLLYIENVPHIGDWERFELHARHVRWLSLWQNRYETAEAEYHLTLTLGILSCHAQTKMDQNGKVVPMFPHLKRLECHHVGESLLHIQTLFRPALCTLSIDTHEYSPTLDASLSYFALSTPALQELYMNTGPAVSLRSRLDAVLIHFQHLRKVTLQTHTEVPYTIMKVLASLPHLRSLTTCLPDRMAPWEWRTPVTSGCFASLRNLHLLPANQVASCTTFLRTFPPVRLRRLQIDQVEITNAQEMHSLFLAISEKISHRSLKELVLSSTGPLLKYCVFSPCMKLLLPFHNMVRLRLNFPGAIMSMSDHEFTAISAAWPNLRSFYLDGWARTDLFVRPTLAAFASMIRNCPNLQQLCFVFDAELGGRENAFERRDSWDDLPSNTAIRQLSVYNSFVPEGTALEVAAAFTYLLPNLDYVTGASIQKDEWAQVQKALPILRAVKNGR